MSTEDKPVEQAQQPVDIKSFRLAPQKSHGATGRFKLGSRFQFVTLIIFILLAALTIVVGSWVLLTGMHSQ